MEKIIKVARIVSPSHNLGIETPPEDLPSEGEKLENLLVGYLKSDQVTSSNGFYRYGHILYC